MVARLQSLGYQAVESAEIVDCDVVLALWTERARDSLRMHECCALALDADKLVQATLDAAAPPRPFDALPCPNLSGERAEFGPLEDAIARIANERAPPAHLRSPQAGLLMTPAVLGAPKLVLTASGAALAAFAGLMTTVQNNFITLEQLQVALSGIVGVSALCAALTAYRLWAIRRSGD